MRFLSVMIIIISIATSSFANDLKNANELIKLGLYNDAIEILQQIIKSDPKNKKVHLALANGYGSLFQEKMINGNNSGLADLMKKAPIYYNSALKLDPNFFEALFNMSDYYQSYGDLENANFGFNKLCKESKLYRISCVYGDHKKNVVEYIKSYMQSIKKMEVFIIGEEITRLKDKKNYDWINNADWLDMESKSILLSGKAFKGTPMFLIKDLTREIMRKRKYYLEGNCYEEWLDSSTNKTIIFVNHKLEKVN